VPHLRDGLIVAKMGIERSSTAFAAASLVVILEGDLLLAVAVAPLVVIPAGDLLLSLPLPLLLSLFVFKPSS
jgi:hypothetical protein